MPSLSPLNIFQAYTVAILTKLSADSTYIREEGIYTNIYKYIYKNIYKSLQIYTDIYDKSE